MALTPITGTNWQTAVEGQARIALVENGVFYNIIPTEPAGILGAGAKGTTFTIRRPNKVTIASVTEGTLGDSRDDGEATGTITVNHYRRAQISLGVGQLAQTNYALATIFGDALGASLVNDFEETAAALYASLTAGTFNATGTSQAFAPKADTATAQRKLIAALAPVADLNRKCHFVLSGSAHHDLIAADTNAYQILGTPGTVEEGKITRMGGFKLWISQNIVSTGSPAEEQLMYFHERAMSKVFAIEPHLVVCAHQDSPTGQSNYADLVQADILQYIMLHGVDAVEPTLGGVCQRLTAT